VETGIETERGLQREIEQLTERGDQTDLTELREELVVVKKKGGGGHGPGHEIDARDHRVREKNQMKTRTRDTRD